MKNTHKLYTDVIAKSGSKNKLLEVTANGTYEAPKGTGYSPVRVNVKLEGNPLQYVIDNKGGDGIPSCYYLFNSYKGTSLDNVIGSIDTSNVTNMSGMFSNCANLTNIPEINTSKVTNMNSMFYSCDNLTSIPQLDTSNVTNMISMFYNCYKLITIPQLNTHKVNNMQNMFGYCHKLSSIPQLDTSNVTNMGGMFYKCYELSSIPPLDTSNVTSMSNMFSDCSNLISIPQLNTSKVTNMAGMFYGCHKLTSIPKLDASKVTDFQGTFYCENLEEMHMTGMKVSFYMSSSTKFTREALVEVLNNLATVTSTKTLTMGSTNLAKLTDEDKSIATNKGWTLA